MFIAVQERGPPTSTILWLKSFERSSNRTEPCAGRLFSLTTAVSRRRCSPPVLSAGLDHGGGHGVRDRLGASEGSELRPLPEGQGGQKITRLITRRKYRSPD